MILSPFVGRRAEKIVNVVRPDYIEATGRYSDTEIYTNLSAIWQQVTQEDNSSDWGKTKRVVDVFRFRRLDSTGALPEILTDYVLKEIATGTRYKILTVINLSGTGEWLKVETEAWSVPVGDKGS